MLNKSAATDARHSRSGKDAMLYNSAGKPFAQVESFTTKGSFNNYKYAPLGQNRELEVNGTVHLEHPMLPVTGEDMQQRSVVQMGSYTL